MKASHKTSRREGHNELLANALRVALEPVAAELRLVDAGDFIAYIHDEKFANIQDIVNSSAELFFKRGAVAFGWGGEYELDWNGSPAITLDMEFRRASLWLVFKLVLRAQQTDVKIVYFSSGVSPNASMGDVAALIEAIAETRLAPRL
ncbi:MAG TPA: hypothetical protein VIE66_17575 [Methylocella sp.]|jgi:hypothetical protein